MQSASYFFHFVSNMHCLYVILYNFFCFFCFFVTIFSLLTVFFHLSDISLLLFFIFVPFSFVGYFTPLVDNVAVYRFYFTKFVDKYIRGRGLARFSGWKLKTISIFISLSFLIINLFF